MRPLHRFLATALALAALSSVPAFASSIDNFTLTDPGLNDVFTFSLPSSPTVSSYGSNSFDVNVPTLEVNGVATGGHATVYTDGYGGGLTLHESGGGGVFGYYGLQLFTGSTSSPTFDLGSFSLGGATEGDTSTLNITQMALSATPEPSTIVLLGTGLLAMAWAARRRFAL